MHKQTKETATAPTERTIDVADKECVFKLSAAVLILVNDIHSKLAGGGGGLLCLSHANLQVRKLEMCGLLN